MYDLNKSQFMKKFESLENQHILDANGKSITLADYCKKKLENSKRLQESTDSLTPIYKTALEINWKQSAMKKRLEYFRENFPEVNSLEKMHEIIISTDPLVFCKKYLLINANPHKPDKNPKYRLLQELIIGFLEYREINQIDTEIESIRHWANNVQLNDLKNDIIGKRPGIGIGVVENIRLNLGMDTIKPDRHVLNVLMYEFGFMNIQNNELLNLATEIGINKFYMDRVLFEYGRNFLKVSVGNHDCK